MILTYTTTITMPIRGGEPFVSHVIDWNSTKSCCEAMSVAICDDFIHFSTHDNRIYFDGYTNFGDVKFCPACGEKIDTKEIAKIKRHCIVEKKLVERNVETWVEEPIK